MHSSLYMRSSWVPEPSQVDVEAIVAILVREVKSPADAKVRGNTRRSDASGARRCMRWSPIEI